MGWYNDHYKGLVAFWFLFWKAGNVAVTKGVAMTNLNEEVIFEKHRKIKQTTTTTNNKSIFCVFKGTGLCVYL